MADQPRAVAGWPKPAMLRKDHLGLQCPVRGPNQHFDYLPITSNTLCVKRQSLRSQQTQHFQRIAVCNIRQRMVF